MNKQKMIIQAHSKCHKLTDPLINSGGKNWVKDENIFRDVSLLYSPEDICFSWKILFPKNWK